jgi:hypothetical protein
MNEEAKVKRKITLHIPDEFKKCIFFRNGTVEIKKCNDAIHNFIFLNTNSGTLRIINMMYFQNHFT